MHHRRRLGKLGWARAFEPSRGLWASGDPPPRDGNSLEVFIDGAHTFQAMAEEIRAARSHVHIAGWHLEPDFVLAESPLLTLRELLSEAARTAQARVLVWSGVPLPPPFRPRRSEIKFLAEELSGGRITCALDRKHRLLHCHHEKILIVDDRCAFVGGLDFSTLGASRLDAREHPFRGSMGWHDTAMRIRGPLVADVAEHFALRWREVTGEVLPEATVPDRAGEHTGQILRTIPETVYESIPRGDFRILEAFVRGLRDARRFIYIENQFLWSSEIVRILAGKLRDPPSDDFRLVVLLPAKPTTGNDDTLGQLAVLAEADPGGKRFLACTLYARDGERMHPVYVHSKTAIIDDRWLMIGSANLNNHSLFNDTEMSVLTCEETLAEETRLRLWEEHLEMPLDSLKGRSVVELVDEVWKPVAVEQEERREAGRPLTHRLVQLPQVSKSTKRLLGPLQTFLVDG
ncbi:MAG TPA: phospholipase D family protein [Actinomycetota bacterium]|nr:phospholipase D family protein [Actinomycetota bacterium]